MIRRIFWLIADSFGIGNADDAAAFGDEGANTLRSCLQHGQLTLPTMHALGLFNIDGVEAEPNEAPIGAFGRLREASNGKDTTIGHWELCGVQSDRPLPTYPNGFPKEILDKLREAFGRDILCNRPYSGTDVIRDYGEAHQKSGALIVYTSADSVLQIAAHEETVPLDELYRCCEAARAIMQGEHGVGRVIARPFRGDKASGFVRTAGRHDYSLLPPVPTLLDRLKAIGKDVIGVGKIHDIFAGQGLTRTIRTASNREGIEVTERLLEEDFEGLCFVNLVDFDMIYGHRRDVEGYVTALRELDEGLSRLLPKLRKDDLLILTADHGCDPAFRGTDHTRENVPLLLYGEAVKKGLDLGVRQSFADVGATVAALLHCPPLSCGTSFDKELLTMNTDKIVLMSAAAVARKHAYAPYSHFAVGAAILTEDGHVFSGCNVENRSYSLTCCAERNALFQAVAAGHRQFRGIAVVGAPEGETPTAPCYPCGACREALAEFFDPATPVYLTEETTTLGALLPNMFTLED